MKTINTSGAIQATEKLILDSKEKIEYYCTMMQELVSTLFTCLCILFLKYICIFDLKLEFFCCFLAYE
jgi:hypothetical protein